jgi:hypothetical protein
LRQRILVILGIAVTLLALYTFLFRARVGVADSGVAALTDEMVATKATGGASKAAAQKPVPAAVPDSSSTPKAAEPAGALVPRVLPPETWGTDPFVRDWVMVNELANFSLKAITLGGDRAYALINDQILEEGDVINGKKVVKIESEMVTLEQGGRTFTLLLGE